MDFQIAKGTLQKYAKTEPAVERDGLVFAMPFSTVRLEPVFNAGNPNRSKAVAINVETQVRYGSLGILMRESLCGYFIEDVSSNCVLELRFNWHYTRRLLKLRIDLTDLGRANRRVMTVFVTDRSEPETVLKALLVGRGEMPPGAYLDWLMDGGLAYSEDRAKILTFMEMYYDSISC